MLLEVAPQFDDVTAYSIRWSQKLHEELGEKHVSCLREEAVRQTFKDYVKEYNPELVTFFDHGSEGALIGNDGTPLLDSGNVALLKGREMYTMCCLAAKNLGAEAYRKGCRTWWGYTQVFSFVPTDEEVFCRLAIMGLILNRKKRLSWEDCVVEVKTAYNEEIDRGGNPWTVISLINNRDCLVVWTVDTPPPTDCLFRMLGVKLLGSAGQRLTRTAALSIALFYLGLGIAGHDYCHQIYLLEGTVWSVEGGYVGFALILLASVLGFREYFKWLSG